MVPAIFVSSVVRSTILPIFMLLSGSAHLIHISAPLARRHREFDNVNVKLDDDHGNNDEIIDPNMLSSVNPRGNFVRQRPVQQFI